MAQEQYLTTSHYTDPSYFHFTLPLKGPKHEIFGSGVFTQIRPVCVGDIGTRPKNPKKFWFRLDTRDFAPTGF
jgi:hypothetical protein